MVAYAFETITAEQARNIGLGDTLTINSGPARDISVVYQSYDPLQLTPEIPSILITAAGRTVAFSTNLVQLSDVGAIVMADGSQLFIGDTSGERTAGGDEPDGLYGGPGDDSLIGGAGDDALQGNSGDDVLTGGDGADWLYGGRGNDVIYTASDVVGARGDAGDWANGNQGDDEIIGGGGSDTLHGGQGNDFLAGRDGNDYLSGDLGEDELHGGMGDDTLAGGAGNDILQGGFGADVLLAGDGDDRLVAQGPGGVLLEGGLGNDTLTIASAEGAVYGGEGRDVFEVVARGVPAEAPNLRIWDWEASDSLRFPEVSIFTTATDGILPRQYSEFVASTYGEARTIANEHISAAGAKWVAAQVGSDVYVFSDTGDPEDGADAVVVLVGRTLDDIGLINFG